MKKPRTGFPKTLVWGSISSTHSFCRSMACVTWTDRCSSSTKTAQKTISRISFETALSAIASGSSSFRRRLVCDISRASRSSQVCQPSHWPRWQRQDLGFSSLSKRIQSFLVKRYPLDSARVPAWGQPPTKLRFRHLLCIIEAWTDDVPWCKDTRDDESTEAPSKGLISQRPDDMSDRGWRLIQKICHVEPTHRPTMSQVSGNCLNVTVGWRRHP